MEDLKLEGVSLSMKVVPDKKIYNDGPKDENAPKNTKDPQSNISKKIFASKNGH